MFTNFSMQLANYISCVYYITEDKTKIINKEEDHQQSKEDQYTELQRL